MEIGWDADAGFTLLRLGLREWILRRAEQLGEMGGVLHVCIAVRYFLIKAVIITDQKWSSEALFLVARRSISGFHCSISRLRTSKMVRRLAKAGGNAEVA